MTEPMNNSSNNSFSFSEDKKNTHTLRECMHRVIFVRQPGVKSERKQTRGKKHTTTTTTTNNDYDVMKKKKKKKNQNKATQGCKNSVKHTECLYSWQMFSLREPVFVRISEEKRQFPMVCRRLYLTRATMRKKGNGQQQNQSLLRMKQRLQ